MTGSLQSQLNAHRGLSRRDPFGSLFRDMDKAFGLWSPPESPVSKDYGYSVSTNTLYHIQEVDDGVEVQVQIPSLGKKITKDDISVSFENSAIRVKADKKLSEEESQKAWTNLPSDIYFNLQVVSPEYDIDASKLSDASLKDGVLSLTIPKTSRKIDIKVLET